MSDHITLPRAVGELVQDLIAYAYNDGVEELELPSEQTNKAIDALFAALRAALEEQEQKPEPVAFWHRDKGFYWAKPTEFDVPTVTVVPPLPLYTAPPKPDAIARAVEAEREACAKLADKCIEDSQGVTPETEQEANYLQAMRILSEEFAIAIRARGSK